MPNLFDRLALKVLVLPTIVFVLGVAIPGFVAYGILQRDAERETQDQARMLIQTLESVRRAGEQQPSMAKGGAGFHSVRDLLKVYAKTTPDLPFTFRYVAMNPATSADRPSLYESGLITAFQNSKALPRIQDQGIDPAGRRCAIEAVPIVVNQESCRSCHAAPHSGAKAGSGHVSGFGWKKGEVAGAAVVYIPSDAPARRAGMIFWTAPPK